MLQSDVNFIKILKAAFLYKSVRRGYFVKRYDTIEVQSNIEVYSSFASIFINPVIIKVGWLG